MSASIVRTSHVLSLRAKCAQYSRCAPHASPPNGRLTGPNGHPRTTALPARCRRSTIWLKMRYTYWIRLNPPKEEWYAQYSLASTLIAVIVYLIGHVATCMHCRPESGCQEDDAMDDHNQGTEIRTVPVPVGTPVVGVAAHCSVPPLHI